MEQIREMCWSLLRKIRQFDFCCCLMQFCACARGWQQPLHSLCRLWCQFLLLAVPCSPRSLCSLGHGRVCAAMAGSSACPLPLVVRLCSWGLEDRCTRTASDKVTSLSSCCSTHTAPSARSSVLSRVLKMEHRGKLSCSKGPGGAEGVGSPLQNLGLSNLSKWQRLCGCSKRAAKQWRELTAQLGSSPCP